MNVHGYLGCMSYPRNVIVHLRPTHIFLNTRCQNLNFLDLGSFICSNGLSSFLTHICHFLNARYQSSTWTSLESLFWIFNSYFLHFLPTFVIFDSHFPFFVWVFPFLMFLLFLPLWVILLFLLLFLLLLLLFLVRFVAPFIMGEVVDCCVVCQWFLMAEGSQR